MSQELFQAIQAGDAERVQALVARDPALAAARDASGVSAVLLARYHHHDDVVPALLAANPPLDAFDAAAVGDVERLGELLDDDPARADALAADGFFPLALAAYFCQPAAVRLLLERGADVHATARNAMGVQALHAAVAARSAESVRLLLDAGADPNVRQHGGWTPLMGAAAHGDDEIVDLLLGHGADPAAVNDGQRDAAALAAENGHAATADRLGAHAR
jgi:ankyrin repeat protein